MRAVKRGIVVQISRKEENKIRVKDITKEEYIKRWEEAKLDWNNLMGRNG